ncbi:MAG: hypothetical protein C0412_19745 [Flavobacterium sp.]|nr:hypothetical protein [Flavobacterium sp.]
MKKLTTKKYWNNNYVGIIAKLRAHSKILTQHSLFYNDFIRKITPYVSKGENIIEIGCAPGNNLILIASQFDAVPYGVEYSKEGVMLTKENFVRNKFNPANVIHADFFSKKFLIPHKEKYGIVCSFGFIEHFDNPKKVLQQHAYILKKNGLLIVTIPNFNYINKFVCDKEILRNHNLDIMSLPRLRNIVPQNLKIRAVSYYGGPFNLGLFSYKNKLLESARFGGFILQRILFDPLLILLSKIGMRLNWKYGSPSIILICEKK